MTTRPTAALMLTALIAVAQTAQAQTRPIFAGVGIIADNDQTNSRLTETTAASWTMVVGFDVSAHFGVISLEVGARRR